MRWVMPEAEPSGYREIFWIGGVLGSGGRGRAGTGSAAQQRAPRRRGREKEKGKEGGKEKGK